MPAASIIAQAAAFINRQFQIQIGKKPARGSRGSVSSNRVCKPGSVLDSHLSCRAVADTLHATSPETAGPANVSSTVLLRIEFTASVSFQPTGELLPRLSILTSPGEVPRVPRRSAAARSNPGGRGGFFLLHFS